MKRVLAAAIFGLLALASCGPIGLDVLSCYGGGVPDGALLYDCWAEIDCGCGEQPQYLAETLAAPSDPAALSCWQVELQRTVQPSALAGYGCKWTGSIYHSDPGGQPNAVDDGTGGTGGSP